MADLVRTARSRQRGADVVMMIACGLGFEPRGDGPRAASPDGPARRAHEAPRSELVIWIRAVVIYLLAGSRSPDASVRDDADWALAEVGGTRDGLLSRGRIDHAAEVRIDELVQRVAREVVEPRSPPRPPDGGSPGATRRRS